jgi:hypothetical protein
MQRISFLAFFLIFVFTNDCLSFTRGLGDSLKKSGYSDTSKKRDFIIKTNLGTPFWYHEMEEQTAFSVTVEKLFGKRYSLQLTVLGYGDHYNDYTFPINSYSIGYDRGVQLIPECKFFVSRKKRYSGYYIGAFGFYNFEKDQQTFYPGTGQRIPPSGPVTSVTSLTNKFGFGISNGVQFYLFKRIVIDFLAGIAIEQSYYNDYGNHSSEIDEIGRLMLNIGYRFGIERKKKSSAPDIPWD